MKSTYFLEGADGKKLYNVHWQHEQPKANVLIVHGYGEHIERYNEVAEAFNLAGFSVFGYDFKAHGRSEGVDCYMDDFQEYLDDLDKILSYLSFDKPFYFYAHSVGALTTITYLLNNDVDKDLFRGCVFTGPALKIAEDLSPLLQKMSGIIAAIAPRFKAAALPVDGISKVPEEQVKYKEDPYIYSDKICAAPGSAIIKATKKMQQSFEKVDFPFLVMHGKDDTIIEPKSSEMLYDGAVSSDKEIVMWDDLAHEIMRSYKKTEVIKKMADWMLQRI